MDKSYISTHIKELFLLCLGEEDTFHTASTKGFTCNCPTLIYHNRVFVGKNFELAELTCARKYHPKNQYTLCVESENLEAKNKLQNNAFDFCISWPAMMLNMETLEPVSHNEHIFIRRIESNNEILTTWTPLVIKEYNPHDSEEIFKKKLEDWHTFFSYLQNTKSFKNMQFFLGYWDNTPVATGLFIIKDDAVYIHWIGTLLEFRHKGLGFAITSSPLTTLKKQGIKKAFLFASDMGKPLYEKIGFTTIGHVDVYITKE